LQATANTAKEGKVDDDESGWVLKSTPLSDQPQHLAQNLRIDSAFHPNPGTPDRDLNRSRGLIPARRRL
jgi:hypothetical protein